MFEPLVQLLPALSNLVASYLTQVINNMVAPYLKQATVIKYQALIKPIYDAVDAAVRSRYPAMDDNAYLLAVESAVKLFLGEGVSDKDISYLIDHILENSSFEQAIAKDIPVALPDPVKKIHDQVGSAIDDYLAARDGKSAPVATSAAPVPVSTLTQLIQSLPIDPSTVVTNAAPLQGTVPASIPQQ
jgi:hypothetical protein